MIVRTPLKKLPIPTQETFAFIEKQPRTKFFFDDPEWDDRLVEAKVNVWINQGGQFPVSNYPLPRPYHGVTGEERRYGGNKWWAAQKLGLVPWARECSVCGSKHKLQNHNENYFRPCNARPVCTSCHMLIHRRFRNPNPWLAVVHANAYEGAWFAKLPLFELSREQSLLLAQQDDPFDLTALMEG